LIRLNHHWRSPGNPLHCRTRGWSLPGRAQRRFSRLAKRRRTWRYAWGTSA